jgi:hypothetical protein
LDAFAGVVVFVGGFHSVVGDGLDAVFFVPLEGAAYAASGFVEAYLVAVGVVLVGAVADGGGGVWVGACILVGEVVGGFFLGDGVVGAAG